MKSEQAQQKIRVWLGAGIVMLLLAAGLPFARQKHHRIDPTGRKDGTAPKRHHDRDHPEESLGEAWDKALGRFAVPALTAEEREEDKFDFDGPSHRLERERTKRKAAVLRMIARLSKLPPPQPLPPADYISEDELLEKVLMNWYAVEPDKALRFVQGLEVDDVRAELLNKVVAKIAEQDFDRALEIVKADLKNKDGLFQVSGEVLEKAALSGNLADHIIQLCGLGPGDGNYVQTRYASLDYGSDFPYQKVLDGLADISERISRDGELPVVPGGLLAEWAKRDPQAAYDWLLKGREVEGNSSIDGFMAGYMETVSTQDAMKVAAQWLDPDVQTFVRYELPVELLCRQPDAKTLETFMDATQDPEHRSTHLEGLLVAADKTIRINSDLVREQILSAMTPEQRISHYERLYLQSRIENPAWKVGDGTISLLRKLGHSEAEIARITGPKSGGQ